VEYERGGERMVINHNRYTGRWKNAAFFRDGELVDATSDLWVLKAWMTRDDE
jgi:hypothetical protein